MFNRGCWVKNGLYGFLWIHSVTEGKCLHSIHYSSSPLPHSLSPHVTLCDCVNKTVVGVMFGILPHLFRAVDLRLGTGSLWGMSDCVMNARWIIALRCTVNRKKKKIDENRACVIHLQHSYVFEKGSFFFCYASIISVSVCIFVFFI